MLHQLKECGLELGKPNDELDRADPANRTSKPSGSRGCSAVRVSGIRRAQPARSVACGSLRQRVGCVGSQEVPRRHNKRLGKHFRRRSATGSRGVKVLDRRQLIPPNAPHHRAAANTARNQLTHQRRLRCNALFNGLSNVAERHCSFLGCAI